MRPRCSILTGGFDFSGCGDCTSCPPIERAEMSNSEPSAIVLHGIACIRRIIHKVRFEWRKRFAHRASSFPAGWLAAALIGIGAKVRMRTNAGTRMFATVKTRFKLFVPKRAAANLRSRQTTRRQDSEHRDRLAQRPEGYDPRGQAQSVHHGERRQRYYFDPAHCLFQDQLPQSSIPASSQK